MARLTVLLIGIGLLVLAACDGNGGDGNATPTATMGATAEPPSPPPAATVPSADTTPSFESARGPVENEGVTLASPIASPAGQDRYYEFYPPLLVDVRTGRHDEEGFDRVVFEFRSVLPGYRIEYVQSPITACGSGLPVTIAGNAFLQVRMVPSGAQEKDGHATFGPTELTPGLPSILEVARTCDFEGVLTWVVGLGAEADFTVLVLTNPYRLVVDVAHP